MVTVPDSVTWYKLVISAWDVTLTHFRRISPKLSQLSRQLTERQLGNKLNSSFCFTNVRHVKSDLSQLTDDCTFSLAKLPLFVRFEINCCHGNTNRLYTCHLISQYSGIWKWVSGRVCVEWEAYQAVIYNKKGNAVTARQRGRLIAEELNLAIVEFYLTERRRPVKFMFS